MDVSSWRNVSVCIEVAAGLLLFLLFVCFNISLLIILKKKSLRWLLKITNP